MLTVDLIPLLECPVCGGDSLAFDATTDKGKPAQDGILRCSGCQMQFPVRYGIPKLMNESDRRSRQWRTWKRHLEGFHARHQHRKQRPRQGRFRYWEQKARAFARFVSPGKGWLLDVGCGPGDFRLALGDAPITYVGLDPLLTADSYEFPFVQALAERLPFRAGAFDYVVARSALDHFCELDGFFREAARVLKPGGRMFVEQEVHEIRGPLSAFRYLVHVAKDLAEEIRARNSRQDAPKHMSSFTSSDLKTAVQPTFRVERIQRFNHKWYLPIRVMLELSKA